MHTKTAIAIAALATSGTALAESYQSFSSLDYTRIDIGPVDFDGWLLQTRYYLDERPTLGPLDEFIYINPVSNFGAGYANFEDNDTFLISGEYFFDKFVVGAVATDEDGIDQAWVGYLFSENFLARIEAVDEFDDTELYVTARYQRRLEGNDYLGFTARVDDDLDNLSLSAKYFKGLGGGRYLSLSAGVFDTAESSFATFDGSYFWTERTSASVGLREGGGYALGFQHFFNPNISLGVDYEDNDSNEVVSLRLGAQF